jgi:diacylglycerol kinase (ATP)
MKNFFTRRVIKNSIYSFNGLISALKSEEAFRIEVFLFLILLPLSFYLGQSRVEICLLIISLFIVLITELLNTGLEKTIDRISNEKNELSGVVKDIGSAAVFISLLQVVVVWSVILIR